MSESRYWDCCSRAMWSGGGEFRREAAQVACSKVSPREALEVVEIGAIGGSSRPSCRDLEPLLAIVGRMRASVVAERKRKRRERVPS